MPDPTFEMYYGLPFQPQVDQQPRHGGPATGAHVDMRIRGRGLGEDEDEDEDDNDEDESMSDGSVDGASFCSDSLLPDAPDVDLGGEGGDGRVLKLRGGAGGAGSSEAGSLITSFSGSIRCHIEHAREFYAAVDTILVLGRRVDVQITVGLVRAKLDKNGSEYAEVVGLERGTLGHVRSEKDLHNRLLAGHTRARQDSSVGELRFFVCHRNDEKALLELQEKGRRAQTACLPAHVPEYFQFSSSDSSGRECWAYLWMPNEVTEGTASSLYAEWFKTVVRIASGPQDQTDKLGRHSAQLPEGPCMVQVEAHGRTSRFHSESPLPRETWEAMVRGGRGRGRSAGGPSSMFQLSLTRLQGQAFAQVPGYYPPTPTTRTRLRPEDIFRLGWDSVPTHDRDSVASMVIRRPGHSETVTFKCEDGDVDASANEYPVVEARLRDWLNRDYFFTIAPQWDTYEAIVPGAPDTIEVPAHWEWSKVRSRLLAALARAGSNVERHNVLRIDQRTSHGADATGILQRNRIAWDMDLGTDSRADARWAEFRAVLSVKRFTITVEPKYLDNGRPSLVNPLPDDHQSPLWTRWGCNRPSAHLDNTAREPAQGSVPTEATTAQPHVNANNHNHNRHPPRAHGQEHEQHQHQHQHQGLLHQGVPQLIGAGVDMFQSGKYYREQSFATPLSVQVGDQKPRFPINAPPIEHIRRPRGPDAIESDSMPVVSTHVMTPTEQRTLQQAFFQMRSIALNRAQQCPHKDCTAFFPLGPDNMAAFHAHLDDKHIGSHCPFCDDTLFKHWSASDKQKHFVDNHSEYFTAKGDLLREALLADRTKSKGNVHRREEQYNFCPRCGRNHQLLSSKADRVHHDNACFPGNETTLPAEQYCPRCGNPDHVMVGFGRARQREQHQCPAATDPDHPVPASSMFCRHCALECHQLPVSYGRRHLLNCKALASGPDNWCPWCGVDLKSGPPGDRLKHLAICALKPASGQNPVCTDSGVPLDSPRDLQAYRLRHGLTDLGTANRNERIAVPPRCPVGGCEADLTSWNAQGLYYHFQSHPENVLEEGGGLKSCPFCKCNFETRGWHTKWEKQHHLDDHIHCDQRARRVLNDEIIGSHTNRESPAVLQAIATRDYDPLDRTAEAEHLNKQIASLSETVKRLAEENRKHRDAQRKSFSVYYLTLAIPFPAPPPPSQNLQPPLCFLQIDD